MKVFIINVEHIKTSEVKTSQQGFTSLEAAKNFIKSRSDKPETINAYWYESREYIYRIEVITINDKPLW